MEGEGKSLQAEGQHGGRPDLGKSDGLEDVR